MKTYLILGDFMCKVKANSEKEALEKVEKWIKKNNLEEHLGGLKAWAWDVE